jgi:ribosome-associated heat shock protein Hsp15
MEGAVRIDKWLWAVRAFKTRNQATEACRAGKVRIRDIQVKPSRDVKIGDIILVRTGMFNRTIRVLELLHNRVSAGQVALYMEDITPSEEKEKLAMMRELNYERRERGVGRPTKKHRRDIEKLKNIKPS